MTDKERISQRWTRGSDSYSRYVKEGLDKKKENEEWKKIFAESLGDEPLNILDVATGPGNVAIQLSQSGHKVTAVDMSDGMLERAQENAKLYGQDITFVKGDAESLPFPDESFDAVTSRYALWTIPNPEAALSEWYRVVKKGGTVMYIDGNWYLNLKKSWWRRRWQSLALLYSNIKAGNKIIRRKKKNGTSIDYELWSATAQRPEKDEEILSKLGIHDYQITWGIDKRAHSGMRKFKHTYYGDTFRVTIKK